MDDALRIVIEMNESTLKSLRADLEDVTAEEVDWRPLPQSNSINLIVRHLRIEALRHLASLEHGAPLTSDVTPSVQVQIDAIPLEFDRNLRELNELYTRFIAVLRRTTLAALQEQTALVYQNLPTAPSCPTHFLGFHQCVHLARH